MNSIRIPFIAGVLVVAMLLSVAAAAEPVRVEILAVQEQPGRLNATVAVYGPDGLPVASLLAGSIKATIDGTQIPVNGVQSNATTRSSISVVLMVDVSGSMSGDPMNQARRALSDFVANLQPEDQVAVMSFDTGVRLLQDFTPDKALATQAVSRLAPLGDTALYDAVIEAAAKASQAPTERRLVVLLGDGVATVNLEKRIPSIETARQTGISFVAIGLGSALDKPYLSDLATATGGRFLEAPTPAALRQVYSNLAAAIKTLYSVSLVVPESVDRTVTSKLTLRVSLGAEAGIAEKTLQPFAGAIPPPFKLELKGVTGGAKVREPATVEPDLPADITEVTFEVFVDGQSVYRSDSRPYAYVLDPSTLTEGNHLLKAIATDPRGRRGEQQISFQAKPVAVSSGGGGGPGVVLVAPLAVVVLVVAGAYLVLTRRKPSESRYATRIKPWTGRVPDVTGPVASPAGEWQARETPPPPLPADRPLGRVIVMDEEAIRTGALDSIREYPIGASPLTLGNTAGCDIIVDDPEGRIAGEEARLWVQRGRLVYHKLTTLSAMATEGVTSGWQFLDSGEDIRVGPCRLTFQLEIDRAEEVAAAPAERMPELWPRTPDEPEPLGASSD